MSSKKLLLLIVLSLVLLVSFIAPTTAQDNNRLEFYYEDPNPSSLDIVLLYNNICLEPVLRLNPNLDIQHIEYGTTLDVPVYDRCYDTAEDGAYRWINPRVRRLKYFEDGNWLDRPYYTDEFVFIEPRTVSSVAEIAQHYNICIDALLADNVLLHDFEQYRNFAVTHTTFDIFIPRDAPTCDLSWVNSGSHSIRPQPIRTIEIPADDAVPIVLRKQYNLCPEEFYPLGWPMLYGERPREEVVTLRVPVDIPPCYNDAGQRRQYYDVLGNRLDEPFYSDLPLYLAAPGESAALIALQQGVCLVDLLRINNFPDLPTRTAPIELFIPPTRPCPDDIEVRLVDSQSTTLTAISQELNICPEDLLPLNPQLTFQWSNWVLDHHPYRNPDHHWWILMPSAAPPCYEVYHPQVGVSIYDLERQLNVCYQEFIWERFWIPRNTITNNRFVLRVRRDAAPCYNVTGQRRLYPSGDYLSIEEQMAHPETYYSNLLLHTFESGDTVYSISRQYNVCVHDLLRLNPRLENARPTGYPTFIPRTRPCYDEASGMPLHYAYETGLRLSSPPVADQLIHYGSQPLGQISSYYNVCANRIEDANQWKRNRSTSYLGWIIPTDRPPCYDETGAPIQYVCYHQPVDFWTDYRWSTASISFSYYGTHCYDLFAPETIVWYQNQPYKVIEYEDTLLASRAFTAWCYGVSLDAINQINEVPEVLELLPFKTRAIPLPTRNCYVEKPHILTSQSTIHAVQKGETLHKIGRFYDKPWQWIAAVNDLDEDKTIWPGQQLIIPNGFKVREFFLLVIGMLGFIGVLVVMYWYPRD